MTTTAARSPHARTAGSRPRLLARPGGASPAAKCYTRGVPTTRPRHLVTETDSVAQALDAAARRWPGESRARLILRLVGEGHRAVAAASEADAERRRQAVERTSGALTGVYESGYLKRLRADWPE